MTAVQRFLHLAFATAIIVLGSIVPGSPALAQTLAAPKALNAESIAAVLDPVMADWIGKRNGPGAVVAVVTRDATVFAKGYGLADIAAKRPFAADRTLVRPGSISKLFTAIAVMQLVEAGKLDLDRDVNAYIDFAIPLPDGAVPVTLRRLLNHRAGFEEHFKGLFSRAAEPEPLGDWVRRGLPLRLFPRGDVESYSNYGFALAGYIVERAAGEPFAEYVQTKILDPLGMRRSTFSQPLPAQLAPDMAKGYRSSDQPPLPFFETIIAPPGALAATAEDMARFMRALLNGGELDGVRILPKARLDEMMAPANATPAGFIGLAFFGGDAAGHETVGHAGGTMTFFSDLQLFPEQGIGVFVSRDGLGKITSRDDFATLPNPVGLIAENFLPPAPPRTAAAAPGAANPDPAGVYHLSRRAESTLLRLTELGSQVVITADGTGNLKALPAVFPYAGEQTFKRIAQGLYLLPGNTHMALVASPNGGSYFAVPSMAMQRVPWWLDLRWIAPCIAASILVVVLSLLCWPVAALRRRWKGKPWNDDAGARRKHLAIRLVLLVDAAVIIAVGVLFALASADFTILGAALDPWLFAMYGLAWIGVGGAALAAWIAVSFWQQRTGGRWARMHHALLAASCLMLAWFFVAFRIAGTTLNY